VSKNELGHSVEKEVTGASEAPVEDRPRQETDLKEPAKDA